ncbi:MAG TPA: glycosyltransferase, partial [Bacteroidales bacterium]|nr:glycosyltransferase [Bacteroidales bacterium]
MVTVVLPFYNASKTLSGAVESIMNQNMDDFECILVDNGSNDGSGSIADDRIAMDDRFRLASEPQHGVVPAFNRGAELSKGKYLARMDADDEALPDRLRLQSAFLEKHQQCDAVGGKAEYVSHIPLSEGFKRYVDWVNGIVTEQQIKLKQFVGMPVVNPTMMWRKSSSERYGLYREGVFPEDYEMWLRWLSLGAGIAKVASPVIRWHDYENRLTRT